MMRLLALPLIFVAAAPIGGAARVVDADTLRIGDVTVRLQGLDGPEMNDPYGRRARNAMIEIIGTAPVVCLTDGTFSHGRVVAICRLSDGRDIAQELVVRGLALDCARYSSGRYSEFETEQARRTLRRAAYCQ